MRDVLGKEINYYFSPWIILKYLLKLFVKISWVSLTIVCSYRYRPFVLKSRECLKVRPSYCHRRIFPSLSLSSMTKWVIVTEREGSNKISSLATPTPNFFSCWTCAVHFIYGSWVTEISRTFHCNAKVHLGLLHARLQADNIDSFYFS